MTYTQVLPVASQLSHQDKLRLIHFLLLAVAKEEGCNPQKPATQRTSYVNRAAELRPTTICRSRTKKLILRGVEIPNTLMHKGL